MEQRFVARAAIALLVILSFIGLRTAMAATVVGIERPAQKQGEDDLRTRQGGTRAQSHQEENQDLILQAPVRTRRVLTYLGLSYAQRQYVEQRLGTLPSAIGAAIAASDDNLKTFANLLFHSSYAHGYAGGEPAVLNALKEADLADVVPELLSGMWSLQKTPGINRLMKRLQYGLTTSHNKGVLSEMQAAMSVKGEGKQNLVMIGSYVLPIGTPDRKGFLSDLTGLGPKGELRDIEVKSNLRMAVDNPHPVDLFFLRQRINTALERIVDAHDQRGLPFDIVLNAWHPALQGIFDEFIEAHPKLPLRVRVQTEGRIETKIVNEGEPCPPLRVGLDAEATWKRKGKSGRFYRDYLTGKIPSASTSDGRVIVKKRKK